MMNILNLSSIVHHQVIFCCTRGFGNVRAGRLGSILDTASCTRSDRHVQTSWNILETFSYERTLKQY